MNTDTLDEATKAAIAALEEQVAFVKHELALARASTAKMSRGRKLPLTADERRTRMLWLAGEVTIDQLDNAIDKDGSRVQTINGYEHAPGHEIRCAVAFYLLKEHNGGKDPTAIDPFDRWRKPDSLQVNRTADCAAIQWTQGNDRYQPDVRVYGGWLNTDSIIIDATGKQQVYKAVPKPARGGLVVCASGSRGHAIGHVGGTPDGDDQFDYNDRRCWERLGVIDIASRGINRANRRSTALGWFATNAIFVVPAWAA